MACVDFVEVCVACGEFGAVCVVYECRVLRVKYSDLFVCSLSQWKTMSQYVWPVRFWEQVEVCVCGLWCKHIEWLMSNAPWFVA